jgi:hypothetical protein
MSESEMRLRSEKGRLRLRIVSDLLPALFLLFPIPQSAQSTPSSTSASAVDVQMKNVVYHFTDDISVHIRSLQGQLVPTKSALPVFDDKNSFTLKIRAAEIAISPESLATVLNSYVFAKPDAPLKGLSIQIENGQLKVKGKLHNKGDVPFEGVGNLGVSDDGKIRLHIEKMKALHLPVKGLLDVLGVELADLVKTGKVQGVQIEKNDLILDPATLLPPPHINGGIKGVRLEKGNVVQVFGQASRSALMRIPFANYMAYRGNQLRFGKLTMSDTDLVLIDMNPSDSFDFYLDHYKEQLVAGYTKETPSFGLRVFMRDYNKLRKTIRSAKTKK